VECARTNNLLAASPAKTWPSHPTVIGRRRRRRLSCALITVRDIMSGRQCCRGSLRTRLSRRCADDGGGPGPQYPAQGLTPTRTLALQPPGRARLCLWPDSLRAGQVRDPAQVLGPWPEENGGKPGATAGCSQPPRRPVTGTLLAVGRRHAQPVVTASYHGSGCHPPTICGRLGGSFYPVTHFA
jgi:hypothetical protein